jgi:hypothetical protein
VAVTSRLRHGVADEGSDGGGSKVAEPGGAVTTDVDSAALVPVAARVDDLSEVVHLHW